MSSRFSTVVQVPGSFAVSARFSDTFWATVSSCFVYCVIFSEQTRKIEHIFNYAVRSSQKEPLIFERY